MGPPFHLGHRHSVGAPIERKPMSNTEIRSLTNRIRRLTSKAEAMMAEASQIKTTIRAHFGVGRHGDATVYQVPAVEVSAHTRRAYCAVRVGGAR